MPRWRYAALALVFCVGCLDALVSDEPGYSRLVLPEGTKVPSADENADLNGRIDAYDGVDAPLVDLRTGFAAGEEVHYWDFGAVSPKPVPGFFLTECNARGQAKAGVGARGDVVADGAVVLHDARREPVGHPWAATRVAVERPHPPAVDLRPIGP